ncbi:MAG: hypothetical protein GC184_07950 [Rhizobiales bacterium]|nr:hypothetical protein [Hyphomicrobiales bacterium]
MGTDENLARAQSARGLSEEAVFEPSREETYYDTLYQRLDGLLKELEASGMKPDDALLERLRLLKVEAGQIVKRRK